MSRVRSMATPYDAKSSHKESKYDRQLRLWGPQGQKFLASASVVVLGSSPVATETLKNLILPGVGQFAVVDDAKVSQADLANNYFLQPSDLGRPRCMAVVDSLAELNPDSKGTAIVKDPLVVAKDPNFLCKFTLVICANCPMEAAIAANKICSKRVEFVADFVSPTSSPRPSERQSSPVPDSVGRSFLRRPTFLWIRSRGLFASLELYSENHFVLNDRSETSSLQALRIDNPFPELKQYAEAVDIAQLSENLRSHVPNPVLLIQALNTFRAKKGVSDAVPESAEHFAEVVEIVKQLPIKNDALNLEEALENLKKICPFKQPEAPRKLAEHTSRLFELAEKRHVIAAHHLHYHPVSNGNEAKRRRASPQGADKLADSDDKEELPRSWLRLKEVETEAECVFWITAAAMKEFYELHGELPVSGSVPDMTSDTNSFMDLQKIYKEKAKQDIREIKASVARKLKIADPGTHLSSDTPPSAPCENTGGIDTDRQQLGAEMEELVELLCRHAAVLRVVECATLSSQYDLESCEKLKEFLDSELMDTESASLEYLMFWAAERFREDHGRWPGSSADTEDNVVGEQSEGQHELDSGALHEEFMKIAKSLGVDEKFSDEEDSDLKERSWKLACSFVSGANIELHTVSAMVGGLAAQEAAKLLSHQFTPMKQSFVFSGVRAVGQAISFF